MKHKYLWVLLVLAISLAGCGTSHIDQVKNGAELDYQQEKAEEQEILHESKNEASASETETNELPANPSREADTSYESQATSEQQSETPQTVTQRPSAALGQPTAGTVDSSTTVVPSEKETEEVPVTTPVPSEATDPAPARVEATPFDINYWITYAKDYAAGIGLALDPELTDTWDMPLIASATSKNLERDIQDGLDWYQQTGSTAVWIWARPLEGVKYELYIGRN